MKRPSSIVITGVVAFVLATCASFLAYKFLKARAGQPALGAEVVAAATDVPVGTKLDAANVKLVPWPKASLPAGSISDVKTVYGRVSVRQLSAGDIVTEQKLLPLNSSAGGVMTYMVPQGHRAVTVSVNEVAGVAGFITPGSRVDVVLLSALPGDKQQEDNTSKIILQNISVLASGQVTEQKEGKPTVTPTVTLDLVPDDAEKLIVGTKKGTLQLLLRNIVDTATVNTPGTTISKVLGHGTPVERVSKPAPKVAGRTGEAKPVVMAKQAAAPAKFTVEVIKGGSKSTREFAAQ